MVHPPLCPSELFDAYFQDLESVWGSQSDVDDEEEGECQHSYPPLAHIRDRPFQGDHTVEGVDRGVEACCDSSTPH